MTDNKEISDINEPELPLAEPLKESIKEPEGEKPAVKKSVREELKEGFKQARQKQAEAVSDDKKPKEPRERTQEGKFSPKDKPVSASGAANVPQPESKPEIKAPDSWKAEHRAKWNTLPADIQAEIVRRETEAHKRITSMDEERQYGKSMKEVIGPYMPLINASNTTPQRAVNEMLNYAHILQNGNPQAKGQLLWQLAQKWNADMRITPQAAAQPGYQIQTLHHKLAETEQRLKRLPEEIKQQQEMAQLKSVIDAFAADPKNVHYEKVKPVMAALLSNGQAKDMQDAYDRACYADPEIRSMLHKEEEAKRLAEKKAKADAARNASSSVKGSGLNGAALTTTPPKRSLREELQANFRAATNH